jgi:indolepyruvate ferredoxin oxidoreductase alpha subunit
MNTQTNTIEVISDLLLGDEAVAVGAADAGITAAYSYPGTPATEILEFLQTSEFKSSGLIAEWTANEKTAYEQALGVSMMGSRALVTMKHVGLNVAADPFVNSAVVSVQGGLVLAVADDPSMHSSQNEQDSRLLADFARVICLEPADQQEAYEMTREAFDLSERFHIPVMVRLVTRLSHSRSGVDRRAAAKRGSVGRAVDRSGWTLLPVNARRQWRRHLDMHKEIEEYAEHCRYNILKLSDENRGLGVITTGTARNYYLENLPELWFTPDWLHIGAYPLPVEKIRQMAERISKLIVLENGYPYVERAIRGILPVSLSVQGRMSGLLPPDGELNPDLVRHTLGLPMRVGQKLTDFPLPGRPPQLCAGCPHCEALMALKKALHDLPQPVITGDIGCYTLGALPPLEAMDSCVCMGASIGMAKGAADSGGYPVVALIGDSTFCHSGITPLMDAMSANADITVLILDNEAVGMTGAQNPILPSSRVYDLVRGLDIPQEHCLLVHSHPHKVDEMAALMRKEIEYHGLSVIVCVRECLEMAKKRKKKVASGSAL